MCRIGLSLLAEVCLVLVTLSNGQANETLPMPDCVKTGAATVFFNGKPALKLADVAACPPGSFEIIPNVMIEGQPMVHLSGCAAGSPNVSVGGKSANTLGDSPCPQ